MEAPGTLLRAAVMYVKEFPVVVTICVGTGPDDDLKKIKESCQRQLKNTFILDARGQKDLTEVFTVSAVGAPPIVQGALLPVFVHQ